MYLAIYPKSFYHKMLNKISIHILHIDVILGNIYL